MGWGLVGGGGKGRERRGMRGGGAEDGASTVAEESAREKLSFELWLVSFHGVFKNGEKNQRGNE